ncbi:MULTISPECIES: hypothetical protein [Acidithiobacillaceae]|uniref:Uncharacterized protein n=1 Tax=Igneacidithiobacillus copahuensis TaxID=2724909 RepID=A0AAE2YQN5_9PROT|nr:MULTISPECIES: hypothetical protein [Acidithiobacillaceae]MBU2763332.1 hypothetical protein [Acidithiobacillus caldus]MBU2771176.1 hypothetical protein [Acidithiobacillus caldus]MBU2788397.1 hypothetical protein [Igneacidithiobacillus copahuensis]MBU2796366.1 hypothetical protein [Acidithiobacillus sp. VAN18-2]
MTKEQRFDKDSCKKARQEEKGVTAFLVGFLLMYIAFLTYILTFNRPATFILVAVGTFF